MPVKGFSPKAGLRLEIFHECPLKRDHLKFNNDKIASSNPSICQGDMLVFRGCKDSLGGGFKHFLIFTLTWGNDPI